jgi:hypothetical protein
MNVDRNTALHLLAQLEAALSGDDTATDHVDALRVLARKLPTTTGCAAMRLDGMSRNPEPLPKATPGDKVRLNQASRELVAAMMSGRSDAPITRLRAEVEHLTALVSRSN